MIAEELTPFLGIISNTVREIFLDRPVWIRLCSEFSPWGSSDLPDSRVAISPCNKGQIVGKLVVNVTRLWLADRRSHQRCRTESIHFPIHRKNAISSLGAADPLFALFSLERFNSPLSYSRHQLWDSIFHMTLFSASVVGWQEPAKLFRRGYKNPVIHLDATESNCDKWERCLYPADYLRGLQGRDMCTLLQFFGIHLFFCLIF